MTDIFRRIKDNLRTGAGDMEGRSTLTATTETHDLDLRRGPAPMTFGPPPSDYLPRNARRQRMSAAAASAAEYVNNLEEEVEQLRIEIGTQSASISVLTEANNLLHEDIDLLRRDNDRLLRENTTIAARIEMCAEVLLALRKPIELPRPPVQQHQEHHDVPEAEAAINQALEQEPPTQVERSDRGEAPEENYVLRPGYRPA